jgi:hypothetical protein
MVGISDYKTDLVCTYQYIEEDDESEILYRSQLLQAFGLADFDEEKINSTTEQLYEKYKDNIYIDKMIKADIMKINEIFPDKVTQFRMYFGYETFHLFHNLLCALINNTSINDKSYNNLINNNLINNNLINNNL